MPNHSRRRLRSKKKKIKSVIELLKSRELGTKTCISLTDTPISPEKLPFIWHRRNLDPGFRNKIFACQWITNNHVVYGTKCNSLVLYDCVSNQSLDIPLIKSEPSSPNHLNPCACGIHAIQLNPSKSLLATGGENVNHIGVYSITDFSPYCLLKDCHSDWIFDLRWLDDSCLASCSRDSSLALWRVPQPDQPDSQNSLYSSTIHHKGHDQPIPPLKIVKNPMAFTVSSTPDDRFRALEYLPIHNTMAVVSMSRRLYLYDALRLGLDKHSRPVYTLVLRDAYQEAVALRRWPSEPNCIALATHHCVLLFDIRCSTAKIGAAARCIFPPLAVSGVRSLNFAGPILSYGTSSGQVHFYDLRADDHLSLQLDIGPGWVKPQTCEEDELSPAATLAAAARQAWPQPSASVATGWGAPPPPPSPAQPILIAHSNMPPNWGYHWHHGSDTLRSPIHRFHYPNNRPRDRRNVAVAGASNYYPPPTSLLTTVSRVASSVELDSDDPTQLQSAHSETSSDSSGSSSPIRTGSPVPFMESSTPTNGSIDPGDNYTNSFSNLNTESFSALDTPDLMEHSLPLFTHRRLHHRISLARPLGMNFFPTSMHTNLTSFSTLSTQLRMLAVYTHEYDPTGTRLFTAGGPIASTFYGNVAALWE